MNDCDCEDENSVCLDTPPSVSSLQTHILLHPLSQLACDSAVVPVQSMSSMPGLQIITTLTQLIQT